jgi:hypothetical protein
MFLLVKSLIAGITCTALNSDQLFCSRTVDIFIKGIKKESIE